MPARLNRANFDAGMRAAANQRAHQIGQEVVNEARQRCPVDNGRLRASIDYTVTVTSSDAKVVIGSPLPYAEYFHTGTGVHGPRGTPIVPVSRDFLKFKPKGSNTFLFRRSVKGMEPNPFLADALVAVMGNIAQRRNP